MLTAIVSFSACSGGHGFLGTDFNPKNNISFTDSAGSSLNTSKSAPYLFSTGSFTFGITETNFQGPYAVTVVAWNNPSNGPCLTLSAPIPVGKTAIEAVTAAGCVADGSDVETILVSDGKGNTASLFVAFDSNVVTGDFLALSSYRGMNYQGTLRGNPTTLTLYEDPKSGQSTSLILLESTGFQSDATSGTKQAAISVVGSSTTGYGIANYTLYNSGSTVFAQGALPNGTLLVPGTLGLGQTFTPYVGMTATVVFVGVVPGATACSTVSSVGATVRYDFQGGSYLISYVPGCGITQYVGNQGETFTLTSIGNYSQLGTLGNVKAMSQLSLLDNVTSVAKTIVTGSGFAGWRLGR